MKTSSHGYGHLTIVAHTDDEREALTQVHEAIDRWREGGMTAHLSCILRQIEDEYRAIYARGAINGQG